MSEKLIAYEFNGVRMPVIQEAEWDKRELPYALIFLTEYYIFDELVSYYTLICSSNPFTIENNVVTISTNTLVQMGVQTPIKWNWAKDSENNIAKNELSPYSFSFEKEFLLWSSYDIIITESDSVFLKGTEPVPCYMEALVAYNKIPFLRGLATSLARRGEGAKDINKLPFLVDFEYLENEDGTYTLTGWKGTYMGAPSTICSIPNDERIILIIGEESSEVEPVAYLYNGVKLPEKPDFPITSEPIPGQPDRTQEYQYQFIYQLTEETVVYSFIRNIGKTQSIFYGIGSGDVVEFKLEGDTWTFFHMATNDGLAYLDTIIWSNHDIPDADGNVYLAASEPVPVYE